MKFIKAHIVALLLGVIIIIQVASWIRGGSGSKEAIKIASLQREILAKDEVNRATERERDAYRELKDSTNARLNERNDQLVKEYHTTTIKYETIPVYYNIVGTDTLRAAAERWAR